MGFEIRYYMLIHNKDDIQFVTEFPCFLGHPVVKEVISVLVFVCMSVVHLNFRAGSTFPISVCTVPSTLGWTSLCN